MPSRFSGENMSIKIIATDLDGTLMSPDHITVTENTVKTLQKAHDFGVKFAIATGRTLAVTNNVRAQVPFVDYIIYSNGAGVYDCNTDKVIYSDYMPKDIVEKIVNFLDKYPVYYEVYSGGVPCVQSDRAKYFKNNGLPDEFIDEYMQSVSQYDNLPEFVKNNDVEKINLYYFDGEYLAEIQDYLFSLDDIDCTSPVMGDIEMTFNGVNKGKALDGICSQFGIDKNEAMSFGDADNDIDMLQYCEYGFAMANGSEICKKNAKYQALSNAEDGVAVAVRQYVLSKIKPKLLVSACLLGENCKYSGGNNYNEAVAGLGERFEIIPVCPEVFGGMTVPREPCEITNGKVVSKIGEDCTAQYNDGAEKTLYIAGECNAVYALLKERSPSCGKNFIYDGTFSGRLVNGNGITADLLLKNGILVFGESEINKLLDEIAF